jgi:hypothetical protein
MLHLKIALRRALGLSLGAIVQPLYALSALRPTRSVRPHRFLLDRLRLYLQSQYTLTALRQLIQFARTAFGRIG